MPRMPELPRFRSSVSSRATSCSSSSASLGDDDDAITPAGPLMAAEVPAEGSRGAAGSLRNRPGSSTSSNADVPRFNLEGPYCSVVHIPQDATHDVLAARMDTPSLWSRMLAVQRVFGCYRSARMSAALDDEDLQSRVPSRACLDLLNDSISQLPEDEREQVQYFLEHGEMKPRKRTSLWRGRFA